MSIVITGSIGLRVVVYDVKTGVVVDGCVRRLEVVDLWRSCAGDVCVFTFTLILTLSSIRNFFLCFAAYPSSIPNR